MLHVGVAYHILSSPLMASPHKPTSCVLSADSSFQKIPISPLTNHHRKDRRTALFHQQLVVSILGAVGGMGRREGEPWKGAGPGGGREGLCC